MVSHSEYRFGAEELSSCILEETPIGAVGMAASSMGLAAVEIGADPLNFLFKYPCTVDAGGAMPAARILRQALEQLTSYLKGKREDLNLPVDWRSLSMFQQEVLRATMEIPYGQVVSYGELARRIGKPQSARAVGAALGANPIPLVIPCHRVVGSDGSLHGYLAGLEVKAYLLRMEGLAVRENRVVV